MFTGLWDELREDFLTGAEDEYVTGNLVLGVVGPYDRPPGFNKWKPDGPDTMRIEFGGEAWDDNELPNRMMVSWDPDFDLADPAAQTAFLDLCASLRRASCDAGGCTRPPEGYLVAPESVRCSLEVLAGCVADTINALPTPEELDAMDRTPCNRSAIPSDPAAFTDAARALSDTMYGRPFYFDESRVIGATIDFESALRRRQPAKTVRPVYETFVDFVDGYLDNAPPTLRSCFAYAGRSFVWMITQAQTPPPPSLACAHTAHTARAARPALARRAPRCPQERLVAGMLLGMAICFPMAFLVLLLTTGSLRVALFATLSVVLIVGSLLGFAESAFNYALGTGETIAGTIVIGLAVDYTVHLGHMYTESAQPSRDGKMRDAATVMGATVLAGGITTLGCAIFMFPCQLTFFTKMAFLMAGTIVFSLIFAFFFFMPLVSLFGPTGRIPSTLESARSAASAVREWVADRRQPSQKPIV